MYQLYLNEQCGFAFTKQIRNGAIAAGGLTAVYVIAIAIIAGLNSPFLITTNGIITVSPISAVIVFGAISGVVVYLRNNKPTLQKITGISWTDVQNIAERTSRHKIDRVKDREGKLCDMVRGRYLGRGGFNEVHFAVDWFTGRFFAHYTSTGQATTESAFAIEERLKNEPHFIKPSFGKFEQALSRVFDSSGNPVEAYEYHFFNDFYPHTVRDLLIKNSSFKKKIHVAEQLLKALEKLEAQKILHQDLTDDNIFYDRETNSVFVADFNISALDSHIDDEHIKNKIAFAGKKPTFSPQKTFAALTFEFHESCSEKEKEGLYPLILPVLRASYQKNDVWHMGLILADLFNMKYRRPFDTVRDILCTIENEVNGVEKARAELTCGYEAFFQKYFGDKPSLVDEPKNKNSVQYLIYLMLQYDHTNRPTADELLKRFQSLRF